MTAEVTVSGPLTTETIKRIGPPLVVASALGSTLGIVVAQFVDDLGDGIMALILGGNAVIYNNRRLPPLPDCRFLRTLFLSNGARPWSGAPDPALDGPQSAQAGLRAGGHGPVRCR